VGRLKTKSPAGRRCCGPIGFIDEGIDRSVSGLWTKRGSDPYFVHYYRETTSTAAGWALDRKAMAATVQFSPDRLKPSSTPSRVDLPPVNEVCGEWMAH
jgi:hypothetical protein